jgi:hypothetical protein
VVTRTGVTEREFSEEFASEQELFCAAFAHGQALVAQTLTAAVQDQKRWLARVRSAVVSVLLFFDAQPQWAQLLLLNTPCCGTDVLERRERSLSRLAQLLERGAPKDAGLTVTLKSGLTAQLVIGGAITVVQRRLLKHRGMPLVELAPSLMSLIVLPYLGAEQANAELTRRLTQRSGPAAAARALPRRASYRTSLVLKAIATCPRANNRAVAQAAGLSDEGQTSKLLSRLRRQGLIENVGLGQAYGEANAWLLTSEGARVLRSLLAPENDGPSTTAGRAAARKAAQTSAAQAGSAGQQPLRQTQGRAMCQG